MIRVPVVKKYNVIYVDPPWNYQRKGGPKHIGMAAQTYTTMTDQEIYDLNVAELADENCFLFLWVTWPKLKEGITAIESWGFKYKTAAFVWVKTNKKKQDTLFWGIGHYSRANTEVCLLGIKGKPLVMNHGVHQVIHDILNDLDEPKAIFSPNIQHSRKPDEVRSRIDILCGNVNKIELFARTQNKNWDAWGDEL